MDQLAGDVGSPSDQGSGERRPRVPYKRAVRVGLGISTAVHLLALFLYPRIMQPTVEDPVPFLLPPAGTPAQGMTVVQVVTLEDATDPERPPDPEELTPAERPPVTPGRPDLSDPAGEGLVAPGPTAAERLRPRLGDRRLWAPLDPELNELTVEQRLELELAGRITEWNDSMAAIAAAERAMTDWTFTDGDGKRWGFSEGRIHLGDLTLPLPFGFGTPVGKRDEVNRRAWEWEEIQRGSASGAVRDSWKDRAQAIRARRDRERAEARPDTSGVRR